MLSITATGMVTAVGYDARTSCASIRAGIVRLEPLEFCSTLGEDSGEEAPVLGCSADIVTRGFVLIGRWARLAAMALEDCTRELDARGNDVAQWQSTGMIIVLPQLTPARFESDADFAEGDAAKSFLSALRAIWSRPMPQTAVKVLCRGHAGTAIACREASEWLAAKSCSRVIVVGVDSTADAHGVEWLESGSRLRTESNPAGVLPGEAAAAFVLELPGGPGTRAAPAGASLLDVRTGRESRSFESGELSYGAALAAAAGELAAHAGGPIRQVVSDINGETWRAHELGCVRMHLRTQFADDAEIVVPAASVGDVGAASGALAVNLSVEAFRRGYAGGERIFVFSSSESGEVGVLALGRGSTRQGTPG